MPVYIEASPSLTGVSAASAGLAVPTHDARQFGWVVEGIGTVTAGTVKIEAADTPDYTGTWAEIDSVDLSNAAALGAVMTNALYIGNYPNPFGGFVRARVAAGGVTGGGTVSVRIQQLK